jgi:hypothetical protein
MSLMGPTAHIWGWVLRPKMVAHTHCVTAASSRVGYRGCGTHMDGLSGASCHHIYTGGINAAVSRSQAT